MSNVYDKTWKSILERVCVSDAPFLKLFDGYVVQ